MRISGYDFRKRYVVSRRRCKVFGQNRSTSAIQKDERSSDRLRNAWRWGLGLVDRRARRLGRSATRTKDATQDSGRCHAMQNFVCQYI